MEAYKWGGVRRRNALLQSVVSAWQQHDISVIAVTKSIPVTTWLERIGSTTGQISDNFRMNTSYGRYGAAYNMVGLSCFNDKLPCVWVELLLLPKNPTEAKLQAMSTWDESTEPTKGVMKHTYKVVLYNYCLMQYCCILSYQLVRREGSNPNQRGKVSKSMDFSLIGNR
jgi:hypothetical protein